MRRRFSGLLDALAFVNAHGGAVEQVKYNALPAGFADSSSSWVRLADGSLFGVEAHAEGPYSEDTPDVDLSVLMWGFPAEGSS
jgi:hypothetical protein